MGNRGEIERLRRTLVEDRIRRELREEKGPPPGKTLSERAWGLFNSPIFLFLLSSVVLTGISQKYAQSQSDAAERATRRTAFFQLFTELEYRITRMERDESELLALQPGEELAMKKLGHDALAVATGEAANATSSPEFKNVYLGTIINQIELSAGLPANRELTPVVEALVIDDCETASVLHGELNILRRWIELRHPLIDSGKLPKIPTHVLSQKDQASLVMPDFDRLRAYDENREETQGRARLQVLREACDGVEG